MFNSEEYNIHDMTVVIGGRDIAGLKSLKYKVARKVDHIYAKGRKPHARTKGKKTYTGTLTILQSELEALQKSAPADGDITDLTFNITVVYAASTGSIVITDIIENVDITEYEKGLAEDDPSMVIELPFMAGNIKYNQ